MAPNKSLRYIRKQAGLSQAQVAEMAGITRAYYTQIENGQRIPRPQILKRLALILSTTMDELFALVAAGADATVPDRVARSGGASA